MEAAVVEPLAAEAEDEDEAADEDDAPMDEVEEAETADELELDPAAVVVVVPATVVEEPDEVKQLVSPET